MKASSISICTTEAQELKPAENINAQITLVLSAQYLSLTSARTGLLNPFSKRSATQEEQHDLMQFRDIGQREFERHVGYYVLKQPSVHPPQRKKRLLTLTKKAKSRQVLQLEKDRRVVQKCLHKKLKWSKQTGKPIEKIAEQYVPIPLALADSNGMPIKGQKSNATKALKSRYKDAKPKVFSNSLPEGWVAGCVIVEGMIMVNKTPLGNHRTFADYANFLAKRFLTPHFSAESKEVHLIFDNPKVLAQTPK